ncbi:MAG: hypothetical protein FWE19_03010 [Oscillospiraceae bacterium]|nr:hypothetical protein [Oscillospiraceae bacterium]
MSFLAILLAVLVGIVFLQVYLSKKESKWPGLLLPLITFIISIMAVLGMAVYVETGVFTQAEYIDGEWVVVLEEVRREVTLGAVAGIISTFLLMNIPTVILLVIYASCRGKQCRQRALEKMSIQDLE